MKNQNMLVLSLLKRRRAKGVTQIDAMQQGVWRLAARVYDLRKAGHEIETICESHGTGEHARYVLKRIGNAC